VVTCVCAQYSLEAVSVFDGAAGSSNFDIQILAVGEKELLARQHWLVKDDGVEG
jgi:hypothetical protein